ARPEADTSRVLRRHLDPAGCGLPPATLLGTPGCAVSAPAGLEPPAEPTCAVSWVSVRVGSREVSGTASRATTGVTCCDAATEPSGTHVGCCWTAPMKR